MARKPGWVSSCEGQEFIHTTYYYKYILYDLGTRRLELPPQ
jgi:hypothetical protein